jgi:hypothetical protein
VVLGLLVLLALARLVRPTGRVPDWAGAPWLAGWEGLSGRFSVSGHRDDNIAR